MMTSCNKIIAVLTLSLMFASGVNITQAFAEAAATTQAENVQNSADLVTAIGDEAESWTQSYKTIMQSLGEHIRDQITKVRRDITASANRTKANGLSPLPLDENFADVLTDRIIGRFSMLNVSLKLDEIVYQSNFGYGNIENIEASGGKENSGTTNTIRTDSYLRDKYNSIFCMPDSKNANAECASRKVDEVARPNENFIDFFISDRTWTDEKVLDAMLLARRFFGGSIDRVALGQQGQLDFGNYMTYQKRATQSNLRMSVLNDLASQRAPSSRSGDNMLRAMFSMLSPNGEAPSVDPEYMCGPKGPLSGKADTAEAKQAQNIAAYVCSMGAKANDGTRIISQAALDRIMQHDMYLSGDFYERINSREYNGLSMDKMQVFMKAQQIAQDYRQLKLLQMKTALVAMNLINSK